MAHRLAHAGLHHAHLHERAAEPSFGSATAYEPPTIVMRSASTCGVGGDSTCVTDAAVSNSGTLVIAVAVAVPTTVALVVLFFLHRRIKRRMRQEDQDDKHRSLDFGMDIVPPSGASKKKKKGGPEMSVHTNMGPPSGGRSRGLSMDMDLPSPYLLAGAVHGSGESLHSLTKTISDSNDPYRPSVYRQESREKQGSKLRYNSVSDYGGYSEKQHDSGRNTLLESRLPSATLSKDGSVRETMEPAPARTTSRHKVPVTHERWYPADDQKYGDASPDMANLPPQTAHDMISDTSLPAFPQPTRQPQSPTRSEASSTEPGLNDSLFSNKSTPQVAAPESAFDRYSPPAFERDLPPAPQDTHMQPEFHFELDPPPVPEHDQYEQQHEDFQQQSQDPYQQEPEAYQQQGNEAFQHELYNQYAAPDVRRVSYMGLRPLPREDPADNPEQRANRIRSFYREYFDENRPNPPGHYPVPDPYPYDPTQDYYYDQNIDEAAYYDPDSGDFYYAQPPAPYAEPMARRAMTPPPRMGGGPMARARARSVMSTQSAARPMATKKKLPPPKALMTLPTPHKLSAEDSGATHFAPRSTFRDLQLGRGPDSPLGTVRPFSPAVRSHTPIVGSFDDLAVIPSPYALRKSGTYTSLDFALPPKIRVRGDTASDAGSIRSNRSGMSALQRDAIRAGAYRLSRLPADQVGSRDDFAIALKPKWDLGR